MPQLCSLRGTHQLSSPNLLPVAIAWHAFSPLCHHSEERERKRNRQENLANLPSPGNPSAALLSYPWWFIPSCFGEDRHRAWRKKADSSQRACLNVKCSEDVSWGPEKKEPTFPRPSTGPLKKETLLPEWGPDHLGHPSLHQYPIFLPRQGGGSRTQWFSTTKLPWGGMPVPQWTPRWPEN